MISYFTYLSFSSLFVFFFLCSAAHRDLHSFPTRRSSDLSLAICAPTLAQHAALSCFEPEVMQIYEKRRLSFKQRRDYLIPALEQLGLKVPVHPDGDRKSTRLTSSHVASSSAVFCLKKKMLYLLA